MEPGMDPGMDPKKDQGATKLSERAWMGEMGEEKAPVPGGARME